MPDTSCETDSVCGVTLWIYEYYCILYNHKYFDKKGVCVFLLPIFTNLILTKRFELNFILSECKLLNFPNGQELLFHDGYSYNRKVDSADKKIMWYCSKQYQGCDANLTTSQEFDRIKCVGRHTHGKEKHIQELYNLYY